MMRQSDQKSLCLILIRFHAEKKPQIYKGLVQPFIVMVVFEFRHVAPSEGEQDSSVCVKHVLVHHQLPELLHDFDNIVMF
jgi:hypothetical protein